MKWSGWNGVYMVMDMYQHFVCYSYQLPHLHKYRMRIFFLMSSEKLGGHLVITDKVRHVVLGFLFLFSYKNTDEIYTQLL